MTLSSDKIADAMKPCPFCGAEPRIHRAGTSGPNTFYRVICDRCLSRPNMPGKEAAIEAWNTRTEARPVRDDELVTNLEAARDTLAGHLLPNQANAVSRGIDTITGLQARLSRYETALRFYADQLNPRAWLHPTVADPQAPDGHRREGPPIPSEALLFDKGDIARQALTKGAR